MNEAIGALDRVKLAAQIQFLSYGLTLEIRMFGPFWNGYTEKSMEKCASGSDIFVEPA
jgi:hypothetical protein